MFAQLPAKSLSDLPTDTIQGKVERTFLQERIGEFLQKHQFTASSPVLCAAVSFRTAGASFYEIAHESWALAKLRITELGGDPDTLLQTFLPIERLSQLRSIRGFEHDRPSDYFKSELIARNVTVIESKSLAHVSRVLERAGLERTELNLAEGIIAGSMYRLQKLSFDLGSAFPLKPDGTVNPSEIHTQGDPGSLWSTITGVDYPQIRFGKFGFHFVLSHSSDSLTLDRRTSYLSSREKIFTAGCTKSEKVQSLS